jgi:hypothetical protein
MNINLLKNHNNTNFDCDQYFQNMIKYKKNPANLNTDLLYCLYIAIAYKKKIIIYTMMYVNHMIYINNIYQN